MPIRFPCPACGQLLAIARRKAGTAVNCPKCGQPQLVPDLSDPTFLVLPTEDARAATDGPQPEASAEDVPPPSDELDDLLDVLLDSPGPAAAGAPRPIGPLVVTPKVTVSPPPAPSPSAFPNRGAARMAVAGGAVPPRMIPVSRRSIYLQLAVLAAVAMVALAIGYGIGRRDASVAPPEAAEAERVLVEGKLVYQSGDGLVGDENAVAIFLPAGAKPSTRIDTSGIRPEDSPLPGNSSLRAVRAMGGEYARADAEGDFSVVLPCGGQYDVLLISAGVGRTKGSSVGEVDVGGLNAYFGRPDYLIGRHKYRWSRETFSSYARVEHDFGRGE